tara:strand:+ start:86 stop:283 length:198 start_codon:yes stop_codon:yes gene_type:complete
MNSTHGWYKGLLFKQRVFLFRQIYPDMEYWMLRGKANMEWDELPDLEQQKIEFYRSRRQLTPIQM